MLHQRTFRLACLAVVFLPLVGFCIAAGIVWRYGGVGLPEATVCSVLFVLTLLGIEMGYHRHFAHGAFRAKPAVRHVLGALGSMACQGAVVWWSGIHRTHHRHSDQPGDPHSPLEGFWQAHAGWLLAKNVNPPRWTRRTRDLVRDPVVVAVHRRYLIFALAGFVAPAVVLGAIYGTWQGALSGLLWGGFVRLFLVNHVVWSINSICHTFGAKTYATHDLSCNNYWLMLPSLGFSLHNNHHAFPKSATTSHAWWQIDLCGLVIRLLAALGLVWDVNSPSSERRSQRQTHQPVARGKLV